MVQRAVAPDLEKIRDQEMEFKTKTKRRAILGASDCIGFPL
jgi:hypothetical protein